MIKLENINKSFENNKVLSDLSIGIKKGEFVSIVGASGSGKTTLLNIIGLIDKADSGSVELFEYKNPSKREIMQLRRYKLGYIFQNYLLMNNETVEKNLLLSKAYNELFTEELMINALGEVGLDQSFLDKKVYQLSGGEQQRIAIARVMLKKCEVILADEPTGNLDKKNREVIISLLHDLRESGKTIICATHDHDVADKSDRIISIS